MNLALSIERITAQNKQTKFLKTINVLTKYLKISPETVPSLIEKAKYIRRWRGDNGKWRYQYAPNTPPSSVSETQRRIHYAKIAPWIKGIEPLQVDETNVEAIVKQAFDAIHKRISTGIKCTTLGDNKKVVGTIKRHLFHKGKAERPIDDVIDRAKLLPYVIPIIEKYGVKTNEIRKNEYGGHDYELVGKAKINGKMTAITVILTEKKNDKNKNLMYLSVFGFDFEKSATKSIRRAGGVTAFVDSQSFLYSPYPNRPESHRHNIIIPDISAVSIDDYPDIQLSINHITTQNKQTKFLKTINVLTKYLKIPSETVPYLLEKAKYIRRWRGDNGKWRYQYAPNSPPSPSPNPTPSPPPSPSPNLPSNSSPNPPSSPTPNPSQNTTPNPPNPENPPLFESATKRRIHYAKIAPWIEGIEPLQVDDETNVKAVAKQAFEAIRERIETTGIQCKALDKKLVGIIDQHLWNINGKEKRSDKEIVKRVKLLPYIIPIIEEYGVKTNEIRENKHGGNDYELVGKAEIDGKTTAITVIVFDKKEDKNLIYLSVFGLEKRELENSATKSIKFRQAGGLTALLDRRGFSYSPHPNRPESHRHNIIIPDISAVSIDDYPDIQLSINHITTQNKQTKFLKTINVLIKYLKISPETVPYLIEKAKYIRRWRGDNGKWYYEYLYNRKGRTKKISDTSIHETAKDTQTIASNPWPHNFPPVLYFVDDPRQWQALIAHPDYDAAKNHEDRNAAARLVTHFLNRESQKKQLLTLKTTYPDAIIVPVHAIEEHGKNRIPEALAEFMGRIAQMEVDKRIVQNNKVYRTGKDKWYRFAFRPTFDGTVQKGRTYILVDDVFSYGGSLSELRRYIELHGAMVVQTVTMAIGGHREQIALNQKTKVDLEKKFSIESLQIFLKEFDLYGGEYQALTEPEAYALLRWSPTLDEARDRILEARQGRGTAVLSRSIQGHTTSPRVKDIRLSFSHITAQNKRFKFIKAVHTVAQALDLPLTLEHVSPHTPEPFLFPIQQQLADFWTDFYTPHINLIYHTLKTALDLPDSTLTKAIDDRSLLWHRKLIYSPETGLPLTKSQFNALMQAIEAYLKSHASPATARQLIKDSVTVGKILNRMIRYQSAPALARLNLETLQYHTRNYDWLRADYRHLETALGIPLSTQEKATYQAMEDYCAQKMVRINDTIKHDIQDTLLYGIQERLPKSQINLNLYTKLGNDNRDWKRVADTEMVNAQNLAQIQDEVHTVEPGEKIYFERIEMANACKECTAVHGKIVLWSEEPVLEEKIEDPVTDTAIWIGKKQKKGSVVLGTMHPNCRGSWMRHGGGSHAVRARIEGQVERWNRAVHQVYTEYTTKGIKHPDDQTPGYVDRINELYRRK